LKYKSFVQSDSTMISCDFARRHITISEEILPLCGFQAIVVLTQRELGYRNRESHS